MINVTENVATIPLEKIKEFPNHPFNVRRDEMMMRLIDSIRQVGVLVPAIVRVISAGNYQLISGHRRKQACEVLGLSSMPAVIREVDEDMATIMMVDSNLQREVILPSEKAKAYKMKLEAVKHQMEKLRMDADQSGQEEMNCSVQLGQGIAGRTSRDILADNSPDSSTQIQRYIRLNELIPELLELVDRGQIAMTPAVEVSYLSKEEQRNLLITMESEQASPSVSQALRMKKISRDGNLTDDMILEIMMEQKKPDCWKLSIPMHEVSKFFPSSYTPQQMQKIIIRLLDSWSNRNGGKNHE